MSEDIFPPGAFGVEHDGMPYEPDYTPAEAEAKAKKLIAQGYLQVSARYRALARLPEGKTAYQCLTEADPSWIERFERQARSFYLRVYAINTDPLHVEVPREVFAAFKKLGGPVA